MAEDQPQEDQPQYARPSRPPDYESAVRPNGSQPVRLHSEPPPKRGRRGSLARSRRAIRLRTRSSEAPGSVS
jgi:hypothetical protein